jgi:hypothetical protein
MNPLRPAQAVLDSEARYICRPDGFTAYKCAGFVSDADLKRIGFVRVEFKAVKLRPPVCPVNGAEGGDEPYWARLPHRPDGTRLTLG